jgi:hypothetical protein
MMIADTLASRIFSLTYNKLIPETLPNKLSEELILGLYEIFCECLTAKGNLAYQQISLWESCCMSVLLKNGDRLQRAQSFSQWIHEEVIENGFIYAASILVLLEGSVKVEQLAELHGLYRQWGHPTVLEEIGCEKVRDIGTHRPIPKGCGIYRGWESQDYKDCKTNLHKIKSINLDNNPDCDRP